MLFFTLEYGEKSMLTNDDITAFLDSHDYDIRKTRYARWIDQKCTPDVVWSISDFVLDYIENVSEQFTVKDIWTSDYAKQTIAETYSKPDTDEKAAKNEYNKVFSQPLCLLCYAGILEDISPDKRHLYIVKNKDILEYIAKNDICALRFLQSYIEKVLRDSNLYQQFDIFFKKQDNLSFDKLKNYFISYYHKYTPIQKDYEPKRIFTKVINPLAYKYSKKGACDGYISQHNIKRSDLMYNQDNFRDIYKSKPKQVTRQEWLNMNPEIDRREGYFNQMLSRSRKLLQNNIKQYRKNLSELTMFIPEQDDTNSPKDIHHIFPQSEYPNIKHYIENLIALTPNQHKLFAHNNGNTRIININLEHQQNLLIAKTHSIKYNLESKLEDSIYEFGNLLEVLRVGFNDDTALEIKENDFVDVLHFINCHYENIT